MLNNKTIMEIINDKDMKRISTDIRQNCNLVRNEFGQMNNEAFMMPMLVLQNIQMLEQLNKMNESLALMAKNFSVEKVEESKEVATPKAQVPKPKK